MTDGSPRTLAHLLRSVTGWRAPAAVASLRVRRIVDDAREVQPGDLFVALRGHRADGHDFADEAIRRGAAAMVVERGRVDPDDFPAIQVPDTRRALAQLAAAWYGEPARRLQLVGITGSFGKTGTLSMLHAILVRAGLRAGIIGSDFIGLRLPDRHREPLSLTTPDPLELHRALARIAEEGGEICSMEVTSQGLVQNRVHGLEFALGIFTCIAPLEHRDYHGTFRRYIQAKSRFFDHLAPGAALIFPAGDRVIRTLVEGRDVTPIRCGIGRSADVRMLRRDMRPEGTRMLLEIRRPLPRVNGGRVAPLCIPLEVRIPGRFNAKNAALAATAALCLGASPAAVHDALATVRPPPRRLQLERIAGFHLLDDTATHPESLGALFEIIAGIEHRRLHLVAAIRGGRGAEFNRRYGEALAIWTRRQPVHDLVATSSAEAVDEADRVRPAERDAFLGELRRAGIPHLHRDRLADAVGLALDRTRAGDLLVLIGAQGMHEGAALVRGWVGQPPDRDRVRSQ
jgi:UDP-N-acetylmuramoyl-L-alanyl-D-glutamate--2,6-diaminopimelate ligase